MDSADNDPAHRARFIRHFVHFDSSLRFPLAYSQFSGKPNGIHAHITFDSWGFRNVEKGDSRTREGGPRIFVLGGSTMVEGVTEADTVPGRLEANLHRRGLDHARVYNFGVVSSCFAQMSALVWSHLAALGPDALVIVGGGTDVTNPWTFDPRPGQPYNAFVIEQVYEYLFDTSRISGHEAGLSYETLTDLLYRRLERLRTECGWRTEAWEMAVIASTRATIGRFSGLAATLNIPVFCVLQPTIVRSHPPHTNRSVASEDFLAYLDRQYTRLQGALRACSAGAHPHYRGLDFSGLFADGAGSVFYDPAHYTEPGRQIMAEALADEIVATFAAKTRAAARLRPLLRMGKILRSRGR